MSAPTTPTAGPAGVLPDGAVHTTFLVQANAYAERFELHFAAGPTGRHGNVFAQIFLTPDQARRIAETILADLDGFAERCDKVQNAMGGTP